MNQQRVLLRITEEVVQETTTIPVIQVHFSVRTCYKFHIYIPEIVANEQIAGDICKEIAHRWKLDPEFQACPQNPFDIIDPSVYRTGLRMLGCDKGSLNGRNRKEIETKLKQDKRLHDVVLGDTEQYRLTYPSVVGFESLNLDVLKRFSVILLNDDREVNAKIPRTWIAHTPAGRVVVNHQNPQQIENGVATDDEEHLLNSVRPYVTLAEVKSRRILHASSGTLFSQKLSKN